MCAFLDEVWVQCALAVLGFFFLGCFWVLVVMLGSMSHHHDEDGAWQWDHETPEVDEVED